MVLTILYSIAGLGIAIVNDFKSIEGAVRGSAHQGRAVASGSSRRRWPNAQQAAAEQQGTAGAEQAHKTPSM